MNTRYLIVLCLLSVSPLLASDVCVKTEKTDLGWRLRVDGAPYVIKGVGCNTSDGSNKEDYFQMAKDMGANSVRTWGIMPRAYFDRAHLLGFTVDAGVWFNPVRGAMTYSYQDTKYCARLSS